MAGQAKPPVELDRTVTHRLHALHKLTDRVSQTAYLEGAGMSLSEGRCLAAVGAFSPLSVTELGWRSNLDKAQASRAAQSLVDQGLVVKKASAADGRGVVLHLSAKGEAAWKRVMSVVEKRNSEILACLSAAQRQCFDRALDRLLEHARGADGDPGTE